MVDVETDDGIAEAYVARPDAKDHPGVLLFMDLFGLRPRLRDMADRIASWGYVVLVPNLFYRSGTVAELAPDADLKIPGNRQAFYEIGMPRMKALTVDRAVTDTEAYLYTLQKLSAGSEDAVGITGYCMGGRLSLLAACAYADTIAASGSFHAGGLVSSAKNSPHLLVGQARAELYFAHASTDRSMTAAAIATLEAELVRTGSSFTSEVYAGADHGFTMADTSSYNESAAERHFQALQDLLARSLPA